LASLLNHLKGDRRHLRNRLCQLKEAKKSFKSNEDQAVNQQNCQADSQPAVAMDRKSPRRGGRKSAHSAILKTDQT